MISDLHLGLDDSFSETVKNKAYIVSFLNQLTASDVDELVIDGDLLDEWFIPTGNSQPADLQEFFTKDADNNRTVIDAIKSVMKSGIKVTYIPGNHDMLLNQAILSAILYANVQRRWDALQDANGVAVKLPYATATAAAQDATFCDQQAVTQYFNVDPSVDVVVFGHTHVPVINRYPEGYNREKVYANSGTWIDRNLLGADMTFVAIESGKDTTDVRLMQYQPDGTVTNLEQQ
nr:metallophosphoesterase [Acetobacterium fimetarium]